MEINTHDYFYSHKVGRFVSLNSVLMGSSTLYDFYNDIANYPADPIDKLIECQARKYSKGIQPKCSPGLLLEIKRKALEIDFEL